MTEQNFTLESSRLNDAIVITVTGEVDLSTSASLLAAIEDASATGATSVIVNLAAVGFLDSAGLNSLINGKHSLEAVGIPMCVVVAQTGPVRRLFTITHLIEPLAVVDSLDEAFR